ncbi:MAG TPA: phytanoyl-CoA dioxygenase family protein [Cytophagaceae bacterium]|nr:phytanoyl-CoA dioxygenase family protein [Cytophagaceae bacterium]
MKNTYAKFKLEEKLTDEQILFFNKNGFIHFENFIKPETVELVINSSKEVEKKWIANKVQKVNGVPIKYGKDLDGSPIVQRFAFLSQHSPVISELVNDPRLSALLPIVGKDARIGENEKDGVVFNHYINSEYSKFTQMGWHTDGLRDLFYGTKVKPMLNVGLHLSSLREEHGGLRILPGSHKQGVFDLLFRKKYFLDTKPDPEEVAVIPTAGDLTIHDGRLWHRAALSTLMGEVSRRRVIYFPIITGRYAPKNENSATNIYQRFASVVK